MVVDVTVILDNRSEWETIPMTDPSLKWYPEYKKWELVVCSERGGDLFRFAGYADKEKTLAFLGTMAMGTLPGTVPVSSLRRPDYTPEPTERAVAPTSFHEAMDAARRKFAAQKTAASRKRRKPVRQ